MAALEEHSSVPELKVMAKYMRLVKELEGAKYGNAAYEKLSKDAIAAANTVQSPRWC